MKQIEKETKEGISTRNKILWIVLICLGGLTYFTSYRFMNTIETRSPSASACPPGVVAFIGYSCGDFDIRNNPVMGLEIENLNPSNEFVVLEAFPILAGKGPVLNVNFQVEVSIFAVDEDRRVQTIITKKEKKQIKFLPQPEGQKEYPPQPFGVLTNIQSERYIFVIKILNTEQIIDTKVEDIRMGFVVFNPTFGKNLFYFKAFLFTVALIGWVLYKINLSKLPKNFASSEQKYIGYMGLLLILFDQPFIQYSTINKSFALTMIVVVVIVAQASILILYWFSLLERLSSNNKSLSSGSKWAILIYVLVNFLLLTATFGNLAHDQMENPLLDLQTDPSLSVTLSKYYLYAFVGIGATWTLLRVCPLIARLRDLDWRDSTAVTFSFYYVLCYGFFIISGSLQVLTLKGSRVILLYGITTLYTVLLQVMYASFGAEIQDADKRKSYEISENNPKYEDLDMSDMSGNKEKDKIKLKKHDELKKQPDEAEVDEDEGIEI